MLRYAKSRSDLQSCVDLYSSDFGAVRLSVSSGRVFILNPLAVILYPSIFLLASSKLISLTRLER